MAILNKGFFTGFSGKVGDIVGCNGKSGFYIRRRPAKTTKPPTFKQLAHREKFKLAQSFLSGLRELFRLMPDTGSKHISAFNAALSRVVKEGVIGEYPGQFINYAAVKLSANGLFNAFDYSVAGLQNTLRLSWLDDVRLDNYQVAIVLAYDPLGNRWFYCRCPLGRSNEAVLELSGDLNGQELQTFLFFSSHEFNKVSATLYTGAVTQG